ncbi:hypothetical protein NQ314_011266 [Rhamnusium bicolor]|uniref:SH3 domain-binding glutamic acid-rich protein n=1 Tax=Rhamnusium bicolor TaxID=1586634 RepID=A0AAV8XJ58_9CUCU|nr:hypothetical protein NQ314_011266 [Rhamnusium bicolor]
MVIKVYISGISGNKEVKKRQQRVLLILDSKNVKYEVIDIAEPGAEEAKDFMQNKCTSLGGTISDPNPRHPLPPQIFNDDIYCGDYDLFDMANEIDEMEKFLKIEAADTAENISNAEIKLKNGEVTPDEKEAPKDEENELVTEENEVSNEKESEEKLDEEQVRGNEELIETENSQENTKAVDEPTEDEESKDETTESVESNVKGETKDENVAGAGDEHVENEKEEDEKADNE